MPAWTFKRKWEFTLDLFTTCSIFSVFFIWLVEKS